MDVEKGTGPGLTAMTNHEFAICIENTGYEVSLELRKHYEVLPDAIAAHHNQVRIIDESGEDYHYPAASFDRIVLPASIAARVLQAHA